ncbi:MAG TPA: LuxR C-terminal-related transcriptional regulator, partial [Mycobacterium sp.]|nr:LuxR C-terminal-related transcriptional regulator [Mycobacterium sp.]
VPTVELVGTAIDADGTTAAALLEKAEDLGIVTLHGHRVRFVHPLLAHGVYTNAPAAQRRMMHKRLAGIVDEPELHARHLALAATSGDPETLQSLDAAAQAARMRGAPAAAKELLELAFGLGGDTPERRIQLAGDHFGAGDSQSARALLEETIETMSPGPLRAVALSLLALVRGFDDSFTEAIGIWRRVLADAGDNLALRVPALVMLSQTMSNTGQPVEAMQVAEDAVSEAERLGDPQLLSQAIAGVVVGRFSGGDGVDEASLQRALELEARAAESPSPSGVSQGIVRASMQNALLLAWTGQLEEAHQQMLSMRRRCIDNGEEHELMYLAHMSIHVEIWRGNFAEAAAIADLGRERGMLPSGDIGLGATLTERAALAAYSGSEEPARRDAIAAAAAFHRCGTVTLADWPISVLGFLEVSVGNYEAALTALQPLLPRFDFLPDGSEINVAEFVPDAIEAMIQLGRLDDAEPLVAMLERNGRRLCRPWMLAVGGRCRAMLLAAQGDIDGAGAAAEAAMAEHDRLPMPFERARTQLLVGQLHRRNRQPNAAAGALRDALSAFEEMVVPLWANRTREELARAEVARLGGMQLTPSEQRVAELAASGMTNRDVAAALFISPKTVEANLARIYRKLGIRTRAELGRRMSQSDA